MRVALIFNPESGRGRPKQQLSGGVVERLGELGIRCELFPTSRPQHATELAREAAQKGYDRVVAWGGDGTLNEVMCALVGTGTVMAVLPGGTVNVFARETGIPLDLDGALRVLASGREHRIPVGVAGESPFLLMAGVGLDGEVVRRLELGFKKKLGAVAFWLDGFKLLASYPFPTMRVTCDGREMTGTGLIAGNLKRYGPRYFITPDARLTDPELDVVLFKGRHRRDYVRYLLGVMGRFHLRFKDVEHFKASELTLDTDGDVPMQLDGEAAGSAPARIRIWKDALTVVLPASFSE